MTRMENVAASCLLAVLGLFPLTSFSGDQTGPVVDIRVSSFANGNPSHVLINGTWNAKPACATIGWWAFDIDTSAGRAFLATLLTAKTAGKSVIVWGTGTCTLNPVFETIAQISIQP